MGMWDTIKGWFNVGGVSVNITQAENTFPRDDTNMRGKFVLTTKSDKTILKIQTQFYMEETTGKGEEKEMSFWIHDINMEGLVGRMKEKGGMLGAVGAAASLAGKFKEQGIVPGKAERLWQLAPAIRRLKFERCSPDWDVIAGCPEMSRVVQLDISEDLKIDAGDLQDLLGSPHLANIQVLDLGGKRFGARSVEALTDSSLSHLRKLRLGRCDLDHDAIGAEGAELLLTCEKLAKLRMLHCYGIECGDEWEAKLKHHFGEDVVDM